MEISGIYDILKSVKTYMEAVEMLPTASSFCL